MEHFKVVCKSLNIPDNVIAEWASKIETQYSSDSRHYHNLKMLEYKVQVINEINISSDSLKSALILASIFQYFHFNIKVDHASENCEEFKSFAKDSELKDVRLKIDYENEIAS
jgi:G:T-mismatch repair DNA endonuclease (very short patch repair protein)